MRSLIVAVALAGLLSGCAHDITQVPINPDVAYSPKEPESDALQIMKAAGFGGLHDGDRPDDVTIPLAPMGTECSGGGTGLLGLAAAPLGVMGVVGAGTAAVSGISGMSAAGSGSCYSVTKQDPYRTLRGIHIIAFAPRLSGRSDAEAARAAEAIIETKLAAVFRQSLTKREGVDPGPLSTGFHFQAPETGGAGKAITSPRILGGGPAYLFVGMMSTSACSSSHVSSGKQKCYMVPLDKALLTAASAEFPAWVSVFSGVPPHPYLLNAGTLDQFVRPTLPRQ
ncbi:MAG: hypothetical protein M0Z43_13180 [Acidithiobacillus sp.]|nr:hypothetical protein [Acidithiobacillus sp.]